MNRCTRCNGLLVADLDGMRCLNCGMRWYRQSAFNAPLTPAAEHNVRAAQARGREHSLLTRQAKAAARRAQIMAARRSGISIKRCANLFNVSTETILRAQRSAAEHRRTG